MALVSVSTLNILALKYEKNKRSKKEKFSGPGELYDITDSQNERSGTQQFRLKFPKWSKISLSCFFFLGGGVGEGVVGSFSSQRSLSYKTVGFCVSFKFEKPLQSF